MHCGSTFVLSNSCEVTTNPVICEIAWRTSPIWPNRVLSVSTMNDQHPSPFTWTEMFEAFWRNILNKFFYIYRGRYFYFFLAPASKLFRVMSLNWLHWHFIFHMVCNRKANNTVKFNSVFRYFSAVPGCSGVFRCSGVPVFLVLVHAHFNDDLYSDISIYITYISVYVKHT